AVDRTRRRSAAADRRRAHAHGNVHGPERLPHRAHAGLAHRPPVTRDAPVIRRPSDRIRDHIGAPGGVPAIALENVGRRMGRETVLDGIDLEIAAGRVVVLRGGNGAGKTTLLRMLATRLRPTHGAGRAFGCDLVKHGAEVRRRVGLLSVLGGNYPVLTARENLRLTMALAGTPDGEGIDHVLARVRLESAADKLVRTYSSGMKKRLGLAR